MILVSKLVEKGMTIAFEGKTARVKRHDGVTVLVVVKRGGLYIVVADNIVNSERVQKGIAYWDKQNNNVLAPNCMLNVQEKIIKVEGL